MIEPRLRFKADDGSDFPDWEEKRLEDVVEFLDEKRKPLEAGKRVAGKYPYYGASGIIDYVEDYIFDEELILLSEDGANILDRNYRVCFLAKGKYWVNNHAHVMKAKKGNLNYFICEELETFDYRKYNSGGAQPKLNQASCRSIVVKIPSLPEQQKIADFLSTIDTIIEKQQATVSAWEERKKGVMQKLFSQEVRFKADDGSDFPDWEEKKMTDLFTRIVEKNRTDLPALTIIQGQGTVRRDESDRRISYDSKGLKNYKVVRKDNFIVHLRSFEGGLEIANQDGIVSPAYHVYQGNANVNPKFYYPYFRSNNFIRGHLAICVTGVRDGKNIEMNAFDELLLPCPSLPEQQKIADCLSALDAVIEKQKETLEKWQELKKGLLQQMFV